MSQEKRNTCNAPTRFRKGEIHPGPRLRGFVSGFVLHSSSARNWKGTDRDKRNGRSRMEMMFTQFAGTRRREVQRLLPSFPPPPPRPLSTSHPNDPFVTQSLTLIYTSGSCPLTPLSVQKLGRVNVASSSRFQNSYFFPILLIGRFNTGIGRVAKTTFFLTTAQICHSTPASSLFSSSSASIPDI